MSIACVREKSLGLGRVLRVMDRVGGILQIGQDGRCHGAVVLDQEDGGRFRGAPCREAHGLRGGARGPRRGGRRPRLPVLVEPQRPARPHRTSLPLRIGTAPCAAERDRSPDRSAAPLALPRAPRRAPQEPAPLGFGSPPWNLGTRCVDSAGAKCYRRRAVLQGFSRARRAQGEASRGAAELDRPSPRRYGGPAVGGLCPDDIGGVVSDERDGRGGQWSLGASNRHGPAHFASRIRRSVVSMQHNPAGRRRVRCDRRPNLP